MLLKLCKPWQHPWKRATRHGRRTGTGPVWQRSRCWMANRRRWTRGSPWSRRHVVRMNETAHCIPATGTNAHKERNVSRFVPSVIKSHRISGNQSVTLSPRSFSFCSVSFFSSAWEGFTVPQGEGGRNRSAGYFLSF